MSILSDYIDLVNETITDKTANYSITPQNVGNRLTELAELVPELALPVPLGTIIMYAPASTSEFDNSGLGVASNVSGWAICNGSNGTPNMKGKFVVGYDPSDPDYDTIEETGGSKTVSLTASQNGPHTHTVSIATFDANTDGPTGNQVEQGSETTVTTSESGTGAPHENRPPYFTVLYLKKIA